MLKQVQFYKAKMIIIWHEGQHKQLENGYLGVRDGLIEGFYTKLPEGTDYEDLGNSAIIPGFINLHSHPSEVYTIKSYVEDSGNPNFYESNMYDSLGAMGLGAKGALLQTKLNLAEILRSGCTTTLIYGGPYSRMEADIAGEMGLRAYIGAGIRAGDAKEEKNIWYSPDGHSIVYNFDEESGFKRIGEAGEFVKEYEGKYDGRIRTLLGPTQTMTCTPDMLRKTRDLADKLGIGITIHGAESFMEFETCVRMYGKTPVQLMADTGMLGEDVIVAHCICIKGHSKINMPGDEDLQLLGNSKTTVAHCPMAIARMGGALQSFSRYADAGVNMGIGTDTFPSDMLQEMRLATHMGKIIDGTTYNMTAKRIFYAATINGAKAFGRNDLGRLAPGAKADFVVFNLENIEMTPVRDLIKNIVFSATHKSIDRVYIEGKCLVKDGRVEYIDETALCRELQISAEYAWKKAKQYDRGAENVDSRFPLSCPRYDVNENE